MSYVSQEQIIRAREMDLLSYLRSFEPYELVELGHDRYATKTHDSLKISNGKWYWWSQGFGGASALDYLIKVKGMTLPDAVVLLTGEEALERPKNIPSRHKIDTTKYAQKAENDKGTEAEMKPSSRSVPFLLPKPAENNRRVMGYLLGRKIDVEIIRYCLEHGLLYEEALHHNVVFVGKDKSGKARYAMLRGTLSQKRFIQEVAGSSKAYSFRIPAKDVVDSEINISSKSHTLHVFESAIDALSFATLLKNDGHDWREISYLSLGGVAKSSEQSKELPIALVQFLQDYSFPTAIHLRLDNDEVGRSAAQAIGRALSAHGYDAKIYPPLQGKDYNDYLCLTVNEEAQKANASRKVKSKKCEMIR